jgi:hypothetical protein
VAQAALSVEIGSAQEGEVLEIVPHGQKISLWADPSTSGVSFDWKVEAGSGILTSKTDPSVQYVAPDSVESEEEVTVSVTVTDPETHRTAHDRIVIRLLPPTPPPAAETLALSQTPTPTPLPPSSGDVIVLDPARFITQTVPGGEDFFQDIRPRGKDCVDLRGYTLEITFETSGKGEGKQAQLWFKNSQFENVFAYPESITSSQPMRFNPAVDPCNVCDFTDFSCISSVGAKVWGGTQGVQLTSARLVGPQ